MNRVGTTLFALAIAAMGGAVSAATIQLTGPSSPVAAGTLFKVDVSTTSAEEIIGFGFDVTTSDPLIAVFQSAAVGSWYEPIDLGLDVAATEVFTNPSGDPTHLATLTFLANRPGLVRVGIHGINNANPNQGIFYLESPVEDVDLSTPVTVTPEPTTISMLAAGAALVLFRRHAS